MRYEVILAPEAVEDLRCFKANARAQVEDGMDLSAFPIDDRLRIVHAIWDTLPDDVDLTATVDQQAELERRLAAHGSDPSSAISHEELMRRIENRI